MSTQVLSRAVSGNNSAFAQDSLFCYRDALANESRQNLVCTMRLVPANTRREHKSAALFGSDVESDDNLIQSDTVAPKAIHRFYDPKHLAALEYTLAGASDTYISQAAFDRPQRREVNVSSIQTLFVDLDTYTVGIDTKEAVSRIHQMFDSIGIADPTLTTVSSGRGLYVKIPLDHAVEKNNLHHWKAVESGLINFLSELGADPKAKDASRVLRAVGTLNGKNGCAVEVLQQASASMSLNAVDEALRGCGMYTERAQRSARNLRAARRGISKAAIIMPAEMDAQERSWFAAIQPHSMRKFYAEMLAKQSGIARTNIRRVKYQQFCWHAVNDIDRLSGLRGGLFSEGVRDAYIFWSLVLLAQAELVTPENFWSEACAMTSRVAGAYDPVTSGTLSTLFSKVCERTSHGKDGIYMATKSRLMDEINISSAEEREMSVLCSQNEYRRRTRHAQREAASISADFRSDHTKLMARISQYLAQERLKARNQGREADITAQSVALKMRIHPKTARKHLLALGAQ